LDAEQAPAPPRGDAGRRALAAITLALAACGSPAPLTLGSSPVAAASAEAVTRPAAGTIQAALASFTNTPAIETISLANGSGARAYPIVNYEYAIVSTAQGSAVRARDLRAFLSWAITSGAAQLAQVNFQPLPSSVVTLSGTQITEIKG
jgi:phosphate transport system substrate-binding protein